MAEDGLGHWNVPSIGLVDVTPTRARDFLVECFYHAHRDTLRRQRELLGVSCTDEALRSSAESAVRVALSRAGSEWDEPSCEGLRAATNLLGEVSRSWGAPETLVARHRDEMNLVLSRLSET